MSKTKAERIAGLSKRAKKMWNRMQEDWRYYTHAKYYNSPTMRELIDAGLVGTMGRPVVWYSCFVPVGSRSAKPEKFPQLVLADV